MADIECLACGKTVKLPQFIDSDDYDGQIVCQECKALLHVKLIKGKLRKYKIVERLRPKEHAMNIYVQDEETKQLIQQAGERTGKLIKGE